MATGSKEEKQARLEALAEVEPESRRQAFVEAREAATDAAREVRADACAAIASTADPADALHWLGRLATDEDVGVRHAAVAALAGLPWRGRFDLLAATLGDEDPGVAAVAADGLSYAGDRRAQPVLHALAAEPKLLFGALEGLYALKDDRLAIMARPLFEGLLTPMFEKTIAALALARSGDTEALNHIRRRVRKRFSGERGFILMHIAEADPAEGRALLESVAASPADDQRESALLALTRMEPDRWWAQTQAAMAGAEDVDPFGGGEVLLGLAEIDWQRARPLAELRRERHDALGAAARKVLLAASLREAFPQEVQLRCG